MSGETDDDVDRLAQSIADGAAIDWDAIDKLPADARLRRLFALLQMVDEVGEVHRSLGDPSHATDPDDQTTPAPIDLPASRDNIGQWGHLVLRRKIGEGGFGEVYHAHDTWLDHSVALKLFKVSGSGKHSTDRILHEARKLARIRHPNVVTVHGADSHQGRVGFWMDLIEGTTLEQIVRERRLSAGEAAYIGQEVCRALAAVHRSGIIHRDIKAQNVMRASEDGRIILMDFGAGEFMADAASSPLQGTPVYLAPEIFEFGTASVRSDIYAVGVLMYFLVTGGFPVQGSSVAKLIDAHRRGERGRLRDGRPDLPHEFVSLVERALDPDPARRFASAGEMEGALGGESIHPVPIRSEGTERTALQTIAFGGGVAFIGTFIIGWIACRAFELSLGVHSDFAVGPRAYLSIGASALLPFGIAWSIGLAVLASMGSLFRIALAALRSRMRLVRYSADAATVATLVLIAGIACWLAMTWYCTDIFLTMVYLSVPTAAVDPSTLGPTGGSLQRRLFFSAAYLSFLLALAVWRWFPGLERTASDASRVRSLKLATVVVAALTVVTAAAPWWLVHGRFEVVAFENRAAFVIGSSSEELLLYYPYGDASKHRRVRKDSPTLQRTGAQARLFDRQ